MFGNEGFISPVLFTELFDRGLKLITLVRRNVKPCVLILTEKIVLRKRALIETVNNHLKNTAQIEHSWHRSPTHFAVNVFTGSIAYTV